MAEIHPGREQSEPDPADLETHSTGGSSAIPSTAVKPFRRSQRVRFEMLVGIYISRADEKSAFEEGKTLTVNAHGALLAFSTPVGIGQTLRLIGAYTATECPRDCASRFAWHRRREPDRTIAGGTCASAKEKHGWACRETSLDG